MKITKLETLLVKPRWLWLKVHTDEGLVGWGEPTLEGRVQTVATAVRELERYLIGEDPRRIEHHWQALYRGAFYRGGPVLMSALSGVEQALWDLTGKWLGVPVHQLLGGAVRDRLRLYGGLGDDAVAEAKAGVERGLTAFKMGLPGPLRLIDTPAKVEAVAHRVAAVRAAVGNEVDLAVDFHGRCSPALAIRLASALEPFHPLFIEEPVPPENVDALARVARSTSVPIATGERLMSKWAFREVLAKDAAAVLQPDLSHAGGILEGRKIAALAECHYAAMAPHCPLGPIALAASLQLDACSPNFLVQEYATLGEGYLKTPFTLSAGYVATPTGPGLGIEVDEAALADKLDDGSWATPQFRLEDGSVADW